VSTDIVVRCPNCGAPDSGKPCRYCGVHSSRSLTPDEVRERYLRSQYERALSASELWKAKQAESEVKMAQRIALLPRRKRRRHA
jgi:hypothetical protein